MAPTWTTKTKPNHPRRAPEPQYQGDQPPLVLTDEQRARYKAALWPADDCVSTASETHASEPATVVPPRPAVVVEITQADVDNLAREMMARELGDGDEIPFAVFQTAAADFFEHAVESLANDPEWARRHFGFEWGSAIARALKP